MTEIIQTTKDAKLDVKGLIHFLYAYPGTRLQGLFALRNVGMGLLLIQNIVMTETLRISTNATQTVQLKFQDGTAQEEIQLVHQFVLLIVLTLLLQALSFVMIQTYRMEMAVVQLVLLNQAGTVTTQTNQCVKQDAEMAKEFQVKRLVMTEIRQIIKVVKLIAPE